MKQTELPGVSEAVLYSRCRRCRRPLRNAASRLRGLGPECITRWVAPAHAAAPTRFIVLNEAGA